MPKTMHTPGPWKLSYDIDKRLAIAGGENKTAWVARVDRQVEPTEADANAHLIAAAPDLYEALDLFVDWMDEEEGAHALCDKARAALAKARGEA